MLIFIATAGKGGQVSWAGAWGKRFNISQIHHIQKGIWVNMPPLMTGQRPFDPDGWISNSQPRA
jgi:hypothetical protein